MRASFRFVVFAALVFSAYAGAAQQNPVWTALTQGNDAFAARMLSAGLVDRPQVSAGQRPPVSVVSCSDSRVAPEVVFNQRIGQVFVVRTAGNVVDQFPLASLEFAVAKEWTNLIVVMGHESCGAVQSALDPKGDDKLTEPLKALVKEIRKALTGIPPDQWDPDNPEIVRRATMANARFVANALPGRSEVIQKAVSSGRVTIVAAYYELGTGKVMLVP